MDMSTEDLGIMQFFVSMLIVGIGVALLATGMFTAYFGAGKSQKIGFALLFLGAITLALVIDMAFGTIGVMPEKFAENDDDGVHMFRDALISGVSALSGMIIGMVVILFVLMKVDTVDDLEDLDLEDLEDLDLDEELKKLEEELNQADGDEEKENNGNDKPEDEE
jgi:amino acid transporter